MEEIEFLTIEAYTAFKNVDRSILKLNSILEPYGYTFIAVGLDQLETQFGDLFHLPPKFESEVVMVLESPELRISHEFYQLLTNSPWGHEVTMDREVFMLKRLEDFEMKIINKTLDPGPLSMVSIEMERFAESLIQQLRLLKTGDIYSIVPFQIVKPTRKIITRKNHRPGAAARGKKFIVNDEDIENLRTRYTPDFKQNQLVDFALSNFNLSYQIFDVKTRFITLMSCLESLLNQGREQITHTVSRHTSLIISKNEIEFQKNYSRIKTLYGVRSTIVHGGTLDANVHQDVLELENLVRCVINFCIASVFTKKELFDALNAKGYEKPDVIRHQTWSAFYDEISLAEFKERALPKIRFKKNVHKDIQSAFAIIEKLLGHSYYEYEFLDVAYAKALQTFEMALKLRYKEITEKEWSSKDTLANLIKWFEDRTSFEVENPNFLKHVRHTRNHFSHPSRYGFAGSAGMHLISTVVDLINDMYEDTNARQERISKRKHLLKVVAPFIQNGAVLRIGGLGLLIYKLQVLFVNNKCSPIQCFLLARPIFDPDGEPSTQITIHFEEHSMLILDGEIRFTMTNGTEATIGGLTPELAKRMEKWSDDYKKNQSSIVKNAMLDHFEDQEFRKIRRVFHFQDEG